MMNGGSQIYRNTLASAGRIGRRGWRLRLGGFSSCTISFLVHLLLLMALAYFVVWGDSSPGGIAIIVPPRAATEPQLSVLAGSAITVEPATGPIDDTVGTVIPTVSDVSVPEVTLQEVPDGSLPSPEAFAPRRAFQPRDLLLPSGSTVRGGGYEGRTPEGRGKLVQLRGGTPGSEDAVSRGLAWLAAHQRRDGSWRFDHHDAVCQGLCRNPGTEGSTTASTALALLPFLGAGEIGDGSQYKEAVDRGLYYLTSRMIIGQRGGDLQEGTMYAQGIATIALCEAYAMTEDASMRTPAQAAVDFISSAQHELGGWRYYPGQPGDTTVYGWQIMALKSARMAGLTVSDDVFRRAEGFLDSVQEEDGAVYGYMAPGKMPTPTAVGLLSRMYFGWEQDEPRLAAGVTYLEQLGSSNTDVYFNYYAQQVMHHFEGDGWDAWNRQLRDRLIATQSRRGHEHGSWYFPDEHGKSGGRLYTTAMCLMTLEVYYRHMPLYGKTVLDEDL